MAKKDKDVFAYLKDNVSPLFADMFMRAKKDGVSSPQQVNASKSNNNSNNSSYHSFIICEYYSCVIIVVATTDVWGDRGILNAHRSIIIKATPATPDLSALTPL